MMSWLPQKEAIKFIVKYISFINIVKLCTIYCNAVATFILTNIIIQKFFFLTYVILMIVISTVLDCYINCLHCIYPKSQQWQLLNLL